MLFLSGSCSETEVSEQLYYFLPYYEYFGENIHKNLQSKWGKAGIYDFLTDFLNLCCFLKNL